MAFHRSVSICKPRHFIMRRSRSNRRLAFIVPATGSSSLAARCEIAGDDGRTLHFLVFVCCVALRISAESPIMFVFTPTHTHTHTHTHTLPPRRDRGLIRRSCRGGPTTLAPAIGRAFPRRDGARRHTARQAGLPLGAAGDLLRFLFQFAVWIVCLVWCEATVAHISDLLLVFGALCLL